MRRIDFVKRMGYRSISLTNMLAHSNFDSTTGWTSNTMASASVSANVLTVLANSQYDIYGQPISVTNGHKYYHACWQNAPSDAIGTQFYDSANSQYVYHSANAGYEFLSGVYTSTRTSASGTYVVALDTRASGWTQINVKYAVCIDLTAAFGAGLEPTKERMDWLMTQFANNWFTGTVTAKYHW